MTAVAAAVEPHLFFILSFFSFRVHVYVLTSARDLMQQSRNDFDEVTFSTLLQFLPLVLRTSLPEKIKHAQDFFLHERHFEVLRLLDNVLQECKAVRTAACTSLAAEGPSSLSLPPQYRNVCLHSITVVEEGTCSATPLPTHLSIRLFEQFILTSGLYRASKERSNQCRHLIEEIRNTAGWRLVSTTQSDCQTSYRYDAEHDHHYFKLCGSVHASILYLCCALMELDLYSEWLPLCASSISMGEVSPFHKASYFIMRMPWPFASREVFVLGSGIDDLEDHNRIIIVARSIPRLERRSGGDASATASPPPLPPGIQEAPYARGTVRCDIIYTGFEMTVVSPTETSLSFITSVDPKIDSIPQSALNWVCGKVMHRMLRSMETAAHTAMKRGGVYYQRRRERPDIYDLLRQRYNAVLRRKFSPDEYLEHELPEDY